MCGAHGPLRVAAVSCPGHRLWWVRAEASRLPWAWATLSVAPTKRTGGPVPPTAVGNAEVRGAFPTGAGGGRTVVSSYNGLLRGTVFNEPHLCVSTWTNLRNVLDDENNT